MNDVFKIIFLKFVDALKAKSLATYSLIIAIVSGLFAFSQSQMLIDFLLSVCAPCALWMPQALKIIAFLAAMFGVGLHTTVPLAKAGDPAAVKRLDEKRK